MPTMRMHVTVLME